jgi:hypothetical protein
VIRADGYVGIRSDGNYVIYHVLCIQSHPIPANISQIGLFEASQLCGALCSHPHQVLLFSRGHATPTNCCFLFLCFFCSSVGNLFFPSEVFASSLPVLSRQGIVACAYLHAFTRSRFVDVCPTFSHFDARVLRDAVCRSRSPSNSWHVSFCIFVLLLCSFLSTSLLRLLISFSFSQCSSHVYLRFLYQLPLSFMQSEWCRQQRVARSHVAGLLLLFSLCASTVMSPVASSSAPLFAVVRSPRL